MIMRLSWKIFRAIVLVVLLLIVLLPASLYVMLSVGPVQDKIRDVAAAELSKTIGADVSIGRVIIRPFNKLSIRDITLFLNSDTIARVSNVSAGFELYHLLRTGELEIDYALVEGADFHINRETPTSPLNIQPIIEHLRSDKPREDKAFELKINTVILRKANLSYDILSAPKSAPKKFDASHIAVRDLAINAFIPKISSKNYSVHLDHLSFVERSGFKVSTMQAKVDFTDNGARLHDFSVDLPSSHLSFKPINLIFNGFNDIKSSMYRNPITLQTTGSNIVFLPDIKAFVPAIGNINRTIAIDIDVTGTLSAVSVQKLSIYDTDDTAFAISASGEVNGINDIQNLMYKLKNASLKFNGSKITPLVGSVIKPTTAKIISKINDFSGRISASGTLEHGNINFDGKSNSGNIAASGTYRRTDAITNLHGKIDISGLNLRRFTENKNIGHLTGNISGDVTLGKNMKADVKANVKSIEYNTYKFSDVSAQAKISGGERAEINISSDDPNAQILAYVFYEKADNINKLNATAVAYEIDLNKLGVDSKREGYKLGAKLNVELSGNDADNIAGNINISDMRWLDENYNGINIEKINVVVDPYSNPGAIKIDSDFMKGDIIGEYSFSSLIPQLTDIGRVFLPALFDNQENTSLIKKTKKSDSLKQNDFKFNFTLPASHELTSFLDLPVHLLYDADIHGYVDSRNGKAKININAPYLRQGNKLYEDTDVYVSLDSTNVESMIYATTQFPTKKGDMALAALVKAAENRLDTHIDWTIQRAIPLNGSIDFSTLLHSRAVTQEKVLFPLDARVDFNPGTINFGDDVWHILPSTIDISSERISVRKFGLDTGSQSIAINGVVSSLPSDSLNISLSNISLLPIFETLEIDNALIGGKATGSFTAKNIMGDSPSLRCPLLHVDSIGYQRCTIGDADILALWDNDKQSFFLDADITGLEGKKSRIHGDIFPFNEALDMKFNADSVPVGFLKPFMEAFTSDISGRATGYCRLFGTFKDIDLEGDVYADNVKIKIDFTGTSYIASDSVHITPGRIDLNNITIHDTEGHPAMLNGYVLHRCFHEPVFAFDITEAQNLLSYNTTSRDNPDWYGTIYGNGSASVSGYPGTVNINVAMTSALGSSFTFVLSDRLDAEDYSFITFRNVTPDSVRKQTLKVDNTPVVVKQFRQQMSTESDEPSMYNMDIRVDIDKNAAMTLVMDPVGGDEIKARGDGNMHLAYHSANNDLNIWGKYTVSEGSYRFTLQDIIIKDFTLEEGSQIQFDGDPYAVKTNLNAYYATNANLSDLDESFLQDKEVARTNVPVHALMYVSGDIRQPTIDFDLEFPTLSQDTYRKVRSIVSTSDMMNRQIIYLLALNRFYTPDYMTATTKGSELFSVASSTISSQLSSMLGKLSDNWSIAPNLRSDRGDFSDVEVDVALSSRLLNNRLIFNGNFGYRDKSLNSNQFIGDFDIEYLLNKGGTWRLKAYSRYNDRNYYVRTAQTTQGIGIMFRHNFDSFLSFLRNRPKE